MRKTVKSALSMALSAAMVFTMGGLGTLTSDKAAKAAETTEAADPAAISADILFAAMNGEYWATSASTQVTKDGSYSVTLTNKEEYEIKDPRVFVVDLHHLKSVVTDMSKVSVNNVKVFADGNEIPVDATKMKTGDLEDDKDNFRIEIYNQWGPTKEDSSIDNAAFSFSKTLTVSFDITGIENNKRYANMDMFCASNGWKYQTTTTASAITGDGTYSTKLINTSGEEFKDLNVFVVDIHDIQQRVKDYSKIAVKNVKVIVDGNEIPVDATKIITGDIEEEKDNFRIEIYNQYGDTKEASSIDNAAFVCKDSIEVSFDISGIEWGEAAAPAATATPVPSVKPSKKYHAYIGFQSDKYDYRDEWEKDKAAKDYNFFKQMNNPDTGKKNVTYSDATITKNGTYTVGVSGVNLSKASKFNMLYFSTDIPAAMKKVKFSNVKVKIDDKSVATIAKGVVKQEVQKGKKKYYMIMAINTYATKGVDDVKTFKYSMPKKNMSITFTVSGMDFATSYATKTIGVAKNKTFTAGNFKYKVTTTAKMTASKKSTGKVQVVGLSAAGKKASSVSVPASVSKTVNKVKANYTVSSVAASAFKGAKVKSVTLSKNIKSIKKDTFKNCKSLTKLTVNAKLSSVAKNAFNGCKKTVKVSGKSKSANVKKLVKSGYKKFK